jgi:hypothetical protein
MGITSIYYRLEKLDKSAVTARLRVSIQSNHNLTIPLRFLLLCGFVIRFELLPNLGYPVAPLLRTYLHKRVVVTMTSYHHTRLSFAGIGTFSSVLLWFAPRLGVV